MNLESSKICGVLIASAFILGLAGDGLAQGKGGGSMRGGGMRGKQRGGEMEQMKPKAPYEHYEAKGLFETKLMAVFPPGLDCPGVASPYGSKTRYDGSKRFNNHHGYHNGMDISLDIATPLLSIATGDVISKGRGGQLVGNYIWLRYRPADTGLPLHLFALYKHMDSVPPLNVGDKVTIGQEIGPSGLTGTTGGYFGKKGYPHLHLSIYTAPNPEYMVKGPMIGPKSMNYLDPLGLYLDAETRRTLPELSNHALRQLPDASKRVPVRVVRGTGEKIPPDVKLIWPLACTTRS